MFDTIVDAFGAGEGDETVILKLETDDRDAIISGTDGQIDLQIEDMEMGVTATPETVMEGENSVVRVTVSPTLFSTQLIDISLGGDATDGLDYTLSPSDSSPQQGFQLTLGGSENGADLTVRTTGDTIPEPDEAIEVTASFEGVEIGTVTVTVEDDDNTAPTLSSATVDGTSLVLTYDENLDSSSTPAANDFTVTVAGSAVAVTGVSVSGMTVTLTLASAVSAGDAVSLSYTAGTNPIQDAFRKGAADLTSESVTNDTADATAPTLSSATVVGTSLVLTYDENLDSNSTPATTDFEVTVAGSTATVSTVAVSGKTVTLTLASAVSVGDAVTLDYAVGTNPIQDAAGNAAAALTNQSVTNDTGDTTAPTLSSATVDGTSLVLTYSENLDTNSTPAATDFTVMVAGSTATVSAVAVSGKTVTLTLTSPAGHGDTASLDYTVGTNPIQDAAGNAAAALTNQSVTNDTADSPLRP